MHRRITIAKFGQECVCGLFWMCSNLFRDIHRVTWGQHQDFYFQLQLSEGGVLKKNRYLSGFVLSLRCRSLSRLPACPDSITLQNGTCQSGSASKVGPASKVRFSLRKILYRSSMIRWTSFYVFKNAGQMKGQKSVDWQEDRSSSDTGQFWFSQTFCEHCMFVCCGAFFFIVR